MGIKFNPFNGQFDLTGTSSPPGTDYNVNKITLNAGQIAAKSVTLTNSPVTPSLTRLVVIGGVEQDYGLDFTVSGSTLSWTGLTLDGVLEVGDKLVIVYN